MTFWSARVTFEVSISLQGECWLVIFGEHANGHFIAVPSHGICCEAADAEDTFYNAEKLSAAGLGWKKAQALAAEIKKAAKELAV